jgi:hypothetical protein
MILSIRRMRNSLPKKKVGIALTQKSRKVSVQRRWKKKLDA